VLAEPIFGCLFLSQQQGGIRRAQRSQGQGPKALHGCCWRSCSRGNNRGAAEGEVISQGMEGRPTNIMSIARKPRKKNPESYDIMLDNRSTLRSCEREELICDITFSYDRWLEAKLLWKGLCYASSQGLYPLSYGTPLRPGKREH